MDCKKVHTLIDEYLSGVLSEPFVSQLEEHLESCEQCRRMIEGWQLICESLKLEHQRIIESIPEEKLTLIYTRA